MARSHAIYIVRIDGEIKAAFTVKHECDAWLPEHLPCFLEVLRLPDGRTGKPVDVTDEFYEP